MNFTILEINPCISYTWSSTACEKTKSNFSLMSIVIKSPAINLNCEFFLQYSIFSCEKSIPVYDLFVNNSFFLIGYIPVPHPTSSICVTDFSLKYFIKSSCNKLFPSCMSSYQGLLAFFHSSFPYFDFPAIFVFILFLNVRIIAFVSFNFLHDVNYAFIIKLFLRSINGFSNN